MSDVADNAAKEAELHFAAALKVRKPVLPFLGFLSLLHRASWTY